MKSGGSGVQRQHRLIIKFKASETYENITSKKKLKCLLISGQMKVNIGALTTKTSQAHEVTGM